jgi:phosphate transport system substrate-binding protein
MKQGTRWGAKQLRFAVPAVIVAAALGLAACGSSSSSSPTTTAASSSKNASLAVIAPPTSSVALSETGSSLLFPLFGSWGTAYTEQHPNITISTASTGSGVGISSALAGTANIGASDAYLSPAQVQATPSAMNIPLAISSQFIGYNVPGVTGNINLSGSVLSQIYQGKITNWNDPAIAKMNPKLTLPNLPIVTVHRADGSGDTFLFSEFLSAADPNGWGKSIPYGTTIAWPTVTGAVGATGNSGMITACKAAPGCIAYIGISYLAKAQLAGIGEAALKNAAGNFELPTATTMTAAANSFVNSTPKTGTLSMINTKASNGYPIINYEYAIVLGTQPNATTAQAVKSVLSWIISPTNGNASTYLTPVGFIALPAKTAQIAANQIASIH